MKLKLLRHERMARKYHLLWNSGHMALVIRVHNDCIRTIKSEPENHPIIEYAAEKHGLDDLFCSFHRDMAAGSYGFGGVIKKVAAEGDYTDFECNYPHIQSLSNKACVRCDGAGFDIELDRKCYGCNGSGKSMVFDWRSGYALTASLAFFFENLRFSEETSAEEEQHLLVDGICAEPGSQGSSLGGSFGINFTNHLAGFVQNQRPTIEKVKKTMIQAWKHMMPLDDVDVCRFRCSSNNGFLTIDCPGDACGIHMVNHYHNGNTGAEFSCHNVDSPAQCLTLLAGLAAFVEEDRVPTSVKTSQLVAA